MNIAGTVMVSAGSYHLPFDRLGDWLTAWMTERPGVDVVYQHGPGRAVPGAENHVMLPYPELLERCRHADAIVLQGGAGGVMDMRGIGRIPLVVPRVPGHGEVVDEHQLQFTDRVADLGLVQRAMTMADFAAILDGMLTGALPTTLAQNAPTDGTRAISEVLAALPDRLPVRARMRRLWGLAAWLIRRR